jgi:hypothetical protein
MQNATTPCWGEYVEFPYFSGFAINENYTFVENGIPEPLGLHSRVKSTSGQAYFPPISTAYDPAFDPVWPRVINRAIAKFISQYNNSRSSIMGGPYIKELGQTLSTIINPMSSIRDLTLGYLGRAEKHGRRYKRDRKSLSKALGDSYLEYGFGLAPFAQDVVNLFVKADSLRLDVKAIDATASERVFASNDAEPYVNTGYVDLVAYRNVQKYSRVTVRLKGMIRTGIDKNGQISRAQALRILPQDFLPTVYELVPWSWLLDYFTNVGDLIQAYSFPFSDVVWGCRTHRLERRAIYSSIKLNAPSIPFNCTLKQNSSYATGGNGTIGYTVWERIYLTPSDFVPRLEFRLPTNAGQIRNMGAILLQRGTSVASLLRRLSLS